ncbi:N-acetyltransferases,N-acetyltransferases, putative isoform 1 [Theobroma cacao]|uniref:N-acetyltransferases,N-acetyltransferases, putative isoform 1 n=1 Tax=Theobroma cacao TaxID=3641 RepID=A0A061EVI5_THECC|nr:N-acetyltransferases,N-acetyltransferases, putative isoform 1 [Theobroma cacao]
MHPRKSSSSLSPILVGNCEVLIDANKYSCNSDSNSLQISISKNTNIKISVREEMNTKSGNDLLPSKSEGKGEEGRCSAAKNKYMFVLVNPKDVDGATKSYLQEALKLYNGELPTMNYAANTGKQSMFLERCLSNGKYCTLLLKYKPFEEFEEVIAAITYQIIPADTQFAEIPLAAVNSIYQHKVHCLPRCLDVFHSLVCCLLLFKISLSSGLLEEWTYTVSNNTGDGCFSNYDNGFGRFLYMELKKRLQSVGIRTILCWGDEESEGFWLKQGFVSIAEVDKKGRARRLPIKADIRKALCFPGGSTLMVSHLSKDASAAGEYLSFSYPLKLYEKSQSSAPDKSLGQKAANVAAKQCSCSSQGAKRKVWEASLSSLKTKKVKGTHEIDSHQNGCQLDSNRRIIADSDRYGSWLDRCSVSTDKSLVEVTPGVSLINNFMESEAQEGRPNCMTPEALATKELQSNRDCFRIMLMNIADDTKKTHLTKVIENLGGTPTSDGRISTHIVTGKVRKTLNFCTAFCSGAWIVSPSWLKESFREGKFVDELPYILHDEDYVLKYRTELKDSIFRAKARPGALLKGYNLCIAAHVQPPVTTLSAIIRSAGGNIIRGVDKVKEASKTIFIACADDMEEALSAVKKGIWTFSSEWLMNCVMRQELDLEAPQFAESL